MNTSILVDYCWMCAWVIVELIVIVESKLELNVQVLICTDYSIYKLHESIVSTANKWAPLLKRRRREHDEHEHKHELVAPGTYDRSKEDMVIEHIKTYYTEVMDQVNERYRNSFKSDPYLNINIELVGFYIAMDPKDSRWSEMNKYEPISIKSNRTENYFKLNGDLALKDFNEWVESKRHEFVHFDHAFGLTTFDIVSDQDDVDYNGLAYIYGICKKAFSGSIIEDKGAYESVRSFAHELGHNLGADHDGLSSSECSEWENYIMSSKFFPYNQLNSWLFSNCSIKRMKEFLLDFDNNFCLLNRPENYMVEYDERKRKTTERGPNRIYPGEMYDSYDQCQRLNGPFSTPCFEFQLSFCENLYCHKNDTLSECVWVAPAAEGTECGLDSWCQKGRCVSKRKAILNQDMELEEGQEECLDCGENGDSIDATKNSYVYDHDVILSSSNMSRISENEAADDPISFDSVPASTCEDIMDNEFCQMAFQNEFCDDMFYWNGRNIAQEWCKKHCKKCI